MGAVVIELAVADDRLKRERDEFEVRRFADNRRGVVMNLKTIGVIRTPFTQLVGMPIQPPGAAGAKGTVEVRPEYAEGLRDLEGFSHVILLYAFHRSSGYELEVVPYMDSEPRGVFATRAPRRPNPIGLSVVRLAAVGDGLLQVEDVDMLDGTPLLDIKPYVPDFDAPAPCRTGWLEDASQAARDKRSDDRFA